MARIYEFMKLILNLDNNHVLRKENLVDDALSCHCDPTPSAQANTAFSIEFDLLKLIHNLQETNLEPEFIELHHCTQAQECDICIIDGLVCKQLQICGCAIVIPNNPKLQKELIVLHYNTRLGGHISTYQIIGVLSSWSFWPQIQANEKAFIKECTPYWACKIIVKKL